jgi:Undecaprenyl-phosphate glucose phosphotransferase
LVKQKHQLFVSLLGVGDALTVTGACYAAWGIRRYLIEGFPAESWENYIVKEPLFILTVPIALMAMASVGLYRPRRDRSVWSEQWNIVRASVVSLVGLIIVLWAIGNDELIGGKLVYGAPAVREILGIPLNAGRAQFGSLALLLPLFLGLERTVVRQVLRSLRRRGYNLRHVAIVGVGRIGRIACQTIERNTWTGLAVAYFISHKDQNRRTECLGHPVLGGIDDLEKHMEVCKVDAVYLAIPNSRASLVPGILQRLERFSLDIRIVPDVNPRYLPQSMAVGELDGMPVLSYRESPLQGVGGAAKRAIDIVGSSVGLVLFSPIMLVAAIAVRRSGPGRIIFKQRRVSLGGQTFKIYKFRTMYDERDEAGPAPDLSPRWTSRDDPRITPVGRFLRRTSIDELPQLLNVLKGDMSLVGPRPERPELIERFRMDWRGYMLRQHVKAGITGWAQVNGLRGDTSLRKRLQYDRFYIRNWSLWFDLRILALTLVRGWVHRNAH